MNITQTRWGERIANVQDQLFRRANARRTIMALAALAGTSLGRRA